MYSLAGEIFQALLGIVLVTALFVFLFRVRKPKSGTVVAHIFVPGRRMESSGRWYGIYGGMPPQVDDLDQWIIEIADEVGNTNQINVSQAAFLKYEYGAQYP